MSSLRVDAGDARHTSLRVARFQRQRGYAVSQVGPPGHRRVRVVSLHLGLDPAERASHLETVLASVPGQGPLVVAGDLNEGPQGQAWMTLAGRLGVVTDDAPTFPASNPHHRIDAIFASPALTVVRSGPLALDAGDLAAASDHLPVWVDLDVSTLALA